MNSAPSTLSDRKTFKGLVAISTFLVATAASTLALGQTTYLFDFNEISDANGYPGGAGAWNQYAEPDDVTGLIADTSGSTAAGISIAQTGLKDSNNTGWNNGSEGPSWATTDGALTNYGAVDDYFFSDNNSNSEFEITFTGLQIGDTVSLDLFSPRNGSSNAEGFYSYSLDGGSNWIGFDVLNHDGTVETSRWNGDTTLQTIYRGQEDGNDTAVYMNASNVVLTGTSFKIKGDDDGTSGEYATANAMRLTVIPEPSTTVLILGFSALLATTGFRRRA